MRSTASPPTAFRRRTPPCAPLRLLVALVVLAAGGARVGQAQEPVSLAVSDTLWQVQLTTGERFVGSVVAVSAESFTLETPSGAQIQLARAQVVGVTRARGSVRQGRFWADDPNVSRLFFSSTGRGLEAGSGYFGVYELFFPFVAYGLTDRLLVAGGSPFYLAIASEAVPPLYLGPKLSVVQSEGFAAAVGALAVLVPDEYGSEHFGIVYGVGTWGSADNAITAGVGWGYVRDDIATSPVVMLGGESRVGRQLKLITENAFIPGEGGVVITGGVRFFGERLSVDAGLGTAWGDGSDVVLPLVNFIYVFGPAR